MPWGKKHATSSSPSRVAVTSCGGSKASSENMNVGKIFRTQMRTVEDDYKSINAERSSEHGIGICFRCCG